jgi:hypothetical protein
VFCDACFDVDNNRECAYELEKSPDQIPQECVTDKWDGGQHSRHFGIGDITSSYFFIAYVRCTDPRQMFYSCATFAFISH